MAIEKQKKRRRRGERPDGLIQVSLKVGVKPDGKPDRKYFYGKTREEANRKRARYKQTMGIRIQVYDMDIIVSAWVDLWKATYKDDLGPLNDAGYDAQIKRLKAAIGKMRMADVREAHLHEALKEVRGMSESTIRKYLMVIRQAFKRAMANKVIPDDPSALLEAPEGTSGSHRALEQWEINCILKHWNKHRAGLWVLLMMLTGIRRCELIALDWPDIDMVKRRLTVNKSAEIPSNQPFVKDVTKTEAGMRILPICMPLWRALNAVPKEQRVGPVCKSAHGMRLTQSAYDRGIEGFCVVMTRVMNGDRLEQPDKRTELEKRKLVLAEKALIKSGVSREDFVYQRRIIFLLRGHDGRDTFATALYDAGVAAGKKTEENIKAAQYYLGHADIRTTMNGYAKLSKRSENRARSRIVGFLDDWVATKRRKKRCKSWPKQLKKRARW